VENAAGPFWETWSDFTDLFDLRHFGLLCGFVSGLIIGVISMSGLFIQD